MVVTWQLANCVNMLDESLGGARVKVWVWREDENLGLVGGGDKRYSGVYNWNLQVNANMSAAAKPGGADLQPPTAVTGYVCACNVQ